MIKTNRAIVYRLYPNKKQAELFQKTFGCTRFVYNQMLSVQEERYKNNESHLSKFDMNLYCNHNLKTKYTWLKEVDKFALTNAIYHWKMVTRECLSILENIQSIRISIEQRNHTLQTLQITISKLAKIISNFRKLVK